MTSKLAYTLSVMLFSLVAQSQVFLERQVISCTGASGSGSYELDYTVGQAEYTSGEGSSLQLTQGFHQPRVSSSELIVTFAITQPDCGNPNFGSLSVTGVSGCGNTITEALLNGEEVSLPLAELEPGDYKLELIASAQCTLIHSFSILPFDGLCDLVFYNTITPNNDGFNDRWIVDHLTDYNEGQNEVRIMNRWGTVVYEVSNYNNEDLSWSGRDQEGNELAVGTYFYSLKVGDQEFTGFIEVIR